MARYTDKKIKIELTKEEIRMTMISLSLYRGKLREMFGVKLDIHGEIHKNIKKLEVIFNKLEKSKNEK